MSLFRPPRRLFHLLASILAAVLALQLIPWGPAARLFPALSPLLSLGGALANRAFWPAALLGLPVLLLALVHKRWFCYHLCPTGYCAEAAGKLNPGAANRFGAWPRLGGALALVILGGAAFGFMLAPFLDPLSLFSGFFSSWRQPAEWTWPALRALLLAGPSPLASGFLAVLLLSLLRPHLWCLRLCPLGGLQDALHVLRRQVRALGAAGDGAPKQERRLFLGLAAGGAAGLLLRRRQAAGGAPAVLRPPGSAPEAAFKSLCARCGACVKACPSRILTPDIGEAGVAGLLAPRVQYGKGYCFEPCKACTEVCPTGAIRALTLPDKRRLALGTAVVNKTRCLAWRDGLYCMRCQEFCPYAAIRAEERNGVNCPVVDPEVCRGCGACQNDCPAQPKAIIVQPAAQRMLNG